MRTVVSPTARRPALQLIDLAIWAVVLIWGSNFVLLKFALAFMDTLTFDALRLSVGALLLLILTVAQEGWQPPPRRDIWKLIGLGLLGNTFYQLPFIIGLTLTTPGNSSLLIATVPIWTALLAVALGKERITLPIWTGVLLSTVGVLLVTLSLSGVSLQSAYLWGDLLTVLAALSWAAYTVFSKELLTRYSPLRLSALALIPGVLGLWLAAAPSAWQLDWAGIPSWLWLVIIASGVLPIAFAYVVWAAAVKQRGAARTAIYNNAVPLVTFVLAYFTLGEPIMPLQLGGAALVLLGIWLTSKRRPPRAHA